MVAGAAPNTYFQGSFRPAASSAPAAHTSAKACEAACLADAQCVAMTFSIRPKDPCEIYVSDHPLRLRPRPSLAHQPSAAWRRRLRLTIVERRPRSRVRSGRAPTRSSLSSVRRDRRWRQRGVATSRRGARRRPVSEKRLVVESPWSQFTSECRRFGHPPRLDK
jgi:hypothetical protein